MNEKIMNEKIGAIEAIRFYMKTIYVLKQAIKDAEEKIEILQDKITNGEVD